ncbi:MAG: PASTA domain-containing protein [Leeuwenhoekiella sp.]
MGFIRFIFSKSFLIQLVIAVVLIVALVFLSMYWLEKSTNHDQRIAVPDLGKMDLALVKQKLDESDLNYVVIDSSNYNPDFPRYSVIEQTPAPGKFVKENRKIYLVLNPSGYREIEVPNIIGRTRRQAEPTLIAMGFKVGKITYKPYIAEDEVLEMLNEGKKLKAGTSLRKTATIDLVLGDGTSR